jgi:hypothetical protein
LCVVIRGTADRFNEEEEEPADEDEGFDELDVAACTLVTDDVVLI